MEKPALFKSFENRHILLIGDLMLDKYLYGRVDRISPEAPVPILLLGRAEYRPGGAGNVAINLLNLGARVTLGGMIGQDDNGAFLRELLEEKSVTTRPLLNLEGYRTTVKTRLIGGTQHLLRVDDEEIRQLRQSELDLFETNLKLCLSEDRIDGIILQDYNKGLLSESCIEIILSLANRYKVPIAVDPKYLNFYQYSGVNVFKPNLRELQAALPFAVEPTKESLTRATAYLREKLGGDLYCITLSDKGVFLDNGNDPVLLPTIPRNVVDVCGAGDAVLSIIFLAWLSGASVTDLGVLANLAGGQVCEKVGVAPIELDALLREYHHLNS